MPSSIFPARPALAFVLTLSALTAPLAPAVAEPYEAGAFDSYQPDMARG
ncbi:MAG: hypothetical protein GYB53_16395 [Rhodobacteraceae bacterium]|nr:hypothetical protein [Paracoccaceae bacterium]